MLWHWSRAAALKRGHASVGVTASPLSDLGVFMLATTERLEALSVSFPASAVPYRGLLT